MHKPFKLNRSAKALGITIVLLTLAFGIVTWAFKETLANDHLATLTDLEAKYLQDQKHNTEAEWSLLSNALTLSIAQAKKQGEDKVSLVDYKVKQLFGDDLQKIAETLDKYNEPNNPIRIIMSEAGKNLLFNGIDRDDTDGFIVKGETVMEDNSDNCVSFGTERAFTKEMLMHANPQLALEAFTKVALGTGDLIFFQFVTHPNGIDMQKDFKGIPLEHQGKLGLDLDSYDLAGLKTYFMETESWVKTFLAFEFVVPTYIFNRTDLAERPYIEQGIRTDIERYSINVVFNFKTVIDNNPTLKRDLYRFEAVRELLKKQYYSDLKTSNEVYISRNIVIYSVIGLMALFCFMSMNYTNDVIRYENSVKEESSKKV